MNHVRHLSPPNACARLTASFPTRLAMIIVAFSFGFAVARLAAAVPRQTPNILFILTDDQGWPTLGCYGNQHVATPHLDRLAAEGVRFTDAYVTPQCTPTRAALLTGQHTARNGMWHVIPWYGYPYSRMREPAFRENLSRDTFTLAKGLRTAGYVTGIAGKWHLTRNEDGDYNGLKAAAAPHYGFDFAAAPGPGSVNEGDKHVDYLTDQAIAFMRQHRARPWFFFLSHHTLHGKVSAPEALVAKHRARGAPATGLHNATYLAAIEHLDHSIGRLMRNMDELGLRENTIVVFLSDNGGIEARYNPQPFAEAMGAKPPVPTQLTVDLQEFSNSPLRMGKGSHYEGGIRVPCLVRWPGVVATNTLSDTPIHVVDWVPTLLAAAGGRPPESHPLDGVNLEPHLRGEHLPERALFWYMPFYEVRWGTTPCALVREGDWKLIEFFGDWFDSAGRLVPGARLELYNLRRDVSEKRNLAEREPARVKGLQAKLRAWMASIPVEVPAPNPDFDPARQLLEVRTRPAAITRQ